MPPAYKLDFPTVAPGGVLGIPGPDATSNPSYCEDARVRIEFVDDRQQVVLTELAPTSDAGSFTHGLRIADGTKSGNHCITAMPDGLDWCDDTGRNKRLDSADIGDEGIAVSRASCGIPRVGFQIRE